MLEPIGWLDGGTALCVVLFACFFGILSFYKSLKLKAKLLSVTGLAVLSAGFILLGPAVDFVTILITGKNLEPYWLYGFLSYMNTGPVTLFGLYVGCVLLVPKKKWHVLSVYIVLVVIFEIIILYYSFTNPLAIFIYPETDPNGTGLLNTIMRKDSIAFILMVTFLLSGLIFNGLGFLRKSFQSSGHLKRNFLYLSLGWIIYITYGALDALLNIGIITFLVRIGLIISLVFMYIGVRSI
ncbi:MAG: hypothetical protein ACTSRI_13445 [Promethearchaeota archaeon]